MGSSKSTVPTSDSKLVGSKPKNRASKGGNGFKPAEVQSHRQSHNRVLKKNSVKPAKKLEHRTEHPKFSTVINEAEQSQAASRADSEASTAPPTTTTGSDDDGEGSDIDTEIYMLQNGRMLSINHLEAAMRLISQGKHVPSIAAGYGISVGQLVREITRYALEKDADKYEHLVDAVIGWRGHSGWSTYMEG